MRINYVCAWAKKREVSWSGIHFSLYRELCRHFDVTDIDVSYPSNKNVVWEAARLLDTLIRVLFERGYAANRLVNRLMDKTALHKAGGENIIFCTKVFPHLPPRHCYLYIDECYAHIDDMRRYEPEMFRLSNFARYPEYAIRHGVRLQERFFKNAAGIFTMSSWLAEYMTDRYSFLNGKVFPAGGGSNIDVSGIDDSQRTGNKFLFIGRDWERKGGPLVVEAFKLAYEKNPELELHIAGPGRLDIVEHPGIVYWGNVDYSNVAKLYNKCDVFCMPSNYEAYGLVFVEALIFGLPVIGRDVCEMPRIIEDGETGYLLKQNDAYELSGLMCSLIGDKRIADNVKRKREWYLKEYSWESVGNRIAEVIKEKEKA